MLVFVNPFGGKQSAKKIFAEQVKSLLEDAQIQITVQGALILPPYFVVVAIALSFVILCLFDMIFLRDQA